MKQRKLLTLIFGLMFTNNRDPMYLNTQEQSSLQTNNTNQSIKPDPSFIETFIYSSKDFELSKKHVISNFIGQFLIFVLMYSLFFALRNRYEKPVLIPSFVFVFSLVFLYSVSCYNTILHSNSYWTALSLLKFVCFMVTNYFVNNEIDSTWPLYQKVFGFYPFFYNDAHDLKWNEKYISIIFCIIFAIGLLPQVLLLIKQKKLSQIFMVLNNSILLICFVFSTFFSNS